MIIVFGGSFNPLSIAHGKLIEFLLKDEKVDKLIILPTSDKFLIEKKGLKEEDIIPLNKRIEILKKFIQEHPKIELDLVEIDNPNYRTYDSLTYLKWKYPGEEIVFTIGSEKIKNLHKWFNIEDILKSFKFIVLKRSEEDIEKIENDEFFIKHKCSFIFLDYHYDFHNVSSTKIRKLVKKKDIKSLKELTYQYVIYELIKD